MSERKADNKHFTTQERLDHGTFSPSEAKSLAGVSNTKLYGDQKRGLIKIYKRGNASFVRGPDLKRYMGFVETNETRGRKKKTPELPQVVE